MQTGILVAVIALFLTLVSGGVLAYFLFSKKPTGMRSLMAASSAVGPRGQSGAGAVRMRLREDASGQEFEQIKALTRSKRRSKTVVTLEEKFFHAGIFSAEDRKEFQRLRILAPVCGMLMMGFGGYMSGGVQFIVLGSIAGFVGGLQLPFTILDRRIARRSEDIMFYLPLVIEQFVIGVSSSLDIGPCIARVVQMADERDSHNSVTELLRHAELFVKSGVSLEEALNEIGRLSGHTELKHAFMSLAQVAKHGGEVTRQLQELADAVASQRETRIEGKIKRLELEATGPVGLVFVGFLVILLIGFGTQVLKAFT